jgi:hypothetical protein
MFWHVLACFGSFWAVFGSFWHVLADFGSFWQFLAVFGMLGRLWQALKELVRHFLYFLCINLSFNQN